MSKRRRFSAEFKAKVAMDALSGETTISALAAKYGIHPNQISQWTSRAKENIVDGFRKGSDSQKKNNEKEIKDLHAKIGQLTVEKDFLQKAFARKKT